MSSIAAEDTRSSTVARNSAQLNFSIATCFQRSRRVVFAESTIASSKVLFFDFRTTRLGNTKSGRRPPVTACSSKAMRPSRRSLEMCCSKERPARDFRCWLVLSVGRDSSRYNQRRVKTRATEYFPFEIEFGITYFEAPNFRNTFHRSRSFLGTDILA